MEKLSTNNTGRNISQILQQLRIADISNDLKGNWEDDYSDGYGLQNKTVLPNTGASYPVAQLVFKQNIAPQASSYPVGVRPPDTWSPVAANTGASYPVAQPVFAQSRVPQQPSYPANVQAPDSWK